jgi:hypothetical protein
MVTSGYKEYMHTTTPTSTQVIKHTSLYTRNGCEFMRSMYWVVYYQRIIRVHRIDASTRIFSSKTQEQLPEELEPVHPGAPEPQTVQP